MASVITAREIQVLSLLALGLTDDDIACSLHIKGSTVRSHLCRIRQKLGYPSRFHKRDHAWRVKLALYTFKQGWASLNDAHEIGEKQ